MLSRREILVLGGTLGGAAAIAPRSVFAAVPPPVPSVFEAQRVRVRRDAVPGSIYIVPKQHFLYWVDKPAQAVRFGVAVGREGLGWHGNAVIGRKEKWPSWTPTPEMIEREPEHYKQYADGMPGGPRNPLGARALYLYQNGHDTAIRIHGTNEPDSIGRSVSNGCFRMLNANVIYLYDRVPLGAPVVVY